MFLSRIFALFKKKLLVVLLKKILAFRKKVTIRNKTRVKHGQKKQTIFSNERRHERSPTVHKLFITIGLLTITLLPL